jgi:hypothetical protein
MQTNKQQHNAPIVDGDYGDYGDYDYATDIFLLALLIVLLVFTSVVLGM